ncbi:MAG: YceI family protein [Candidatus Acidiferrum sp.]|jgi:polyisoprenoid-binding protein YceI
MLKFAALISSLAVILSFGMPSKPVAPSGPWLVDSRHSDAQLVTDATTNFGKSKINFTLGIARVTGRVKLDNDDLSKSAVDITMYPANSPTPPIGEDGKVRSQWLANLANHTLVCFHSKGFTRTADGHLRATGDLVLTRVDRNVEFASGEAYAGPVYGPPMIHRLVREATFVFDSPAAASGKDSEVLTTGSTNVVTEDFPQLFKAVKSTYWPPVVQDENCESPSSGGEDFSGPHCTGTFLHAPGLPEEPGATTGEDYPAHSDYNAVIGNHLTIAVHLHLKPAEKLASGN